MNEIAKNQTDLATRMAQAHNLYCQTREVNTGELKLNKSGMYVMFGIDKATVDSFAMKDPDTLYDLARSQAVEGGVLFPKCQIVHISDGQSMAEIATIMDKMITLEFIRDQAKEFGIKTLRSQIFLPEALLASHYYHEALNLNYPLELRQQAMRSCKMMFEYFGSNYKDPQSFFKANKEYVTKGDMVLNYASGHIYNSKSEFNVQLESLFRMTRSVTSCPIQEKDLPELEKMLTAKRIKYHIDPEFTTTDNFGTPSGENDKKLFAGGPKARVWHQVYYDTEYDSLINGWYSARYFTCLKDHVKSFTYSPDAQVFTASIPVVWIESFTNYLEANHTDFWLDVNGSYVPSSLSSVGIVVESIAALKTVASAIKDISKDKLEYKEIDRVLETASLGTGAAQKEALAQIEQRKFKDNKQITNNNFER